MMNMDMPMQGLQQSMSGQMPDTDGSMMGGGQEASQILEQAIALHEGHLSGEVPPSEESQQALMQLLLQLQSMLGA